MLAASEPTHTLSSSHLCATNTAFSQVFSGVPSAPSSAPLPRNFRPPAARSLGPWQRVLRARLFADRDGRRLLALAQRKPGGGAGGAAAAADASAAAPLELADVQAHAADTARLQLSLAATARKQGNLSLASRLLRAASGASSPSGGAASGTASAAEPSALRADDWEELRLEALLQRRAAGEAEAAAAGIAAIAAECFDGAYALLSGPHRALLVGFRFCK